MDYSKRMKELRLKARLTQDQLAEIMGLETPNFISQIETGRKRVGLSVITKFCAALGMEISDFFGGNQQNINPDQIIPVIDLSGSDIKKLFYDLSLLKTQDYCMIARPVDLTDRYAYGAMVSGDAMAPALKDRDVVFVAPSQKYRDQDIAIIGLDTGEVLLRRIRITDNMLLLESSNPSVAVRLIKAEEAKFVHPVVWVRYNMPISGLYRC